ncbi:hypothetical protein HDF26_005216 [Pedobacter cryoconitis]|uniref:Nucleotidyltransferase n=1 Tax=Pedobacter cryoconitis TaxID=188932 RepID=A0A7W8ZMN1_9SPHI|nr:nucleotidyltransferase [Pedobacter cryoconitis]MBB5636740.1 hypothetical protein [Pedobacter cryoconitis]MBB6274734.1 hypothetical protein [Pedobacter cryoconitis]
MARSIEQIQAEIIQAKEADSDLDVLNSTSKVAIWRLITFVIAAAISTLEKLFDLHKNETDLKISLLKPHTARWYREKTKAFQYGFPLVRDADYYDNSKVAADLVENSKIIKYAAVTEAEEDSRLIVKIATETAGKLGPISAAQKESFEAYLSEIRDAGVRTNVINFPADKLFLNMRIFRDPLLIDAEGNSILNGGRPIEETLKQYLKEMPFNGELVLASLVDRLQLLPGVKIPHIDSAQSSWIDGDGKSNNYGTPREINVREIPVSGYFEIANFNGIKYVV